MKNKLFIFEKLLDLAKDIGCVEEALMYGGSYMSIKGTCGGEIFTISFDVKEQKND